MPRRQPTPPTAGITGAAGAIAAPAFPALSDYLSKTVAFRFEGHTLRLALSQSLFSSYDVDGGSRLLLASVVRQLAVRPGEQRGLRSILDLGCGTGVLGLALAKRFAANLTARDRDALALAVTAHNAAANGIACTTRGGVDTTGLDGARERPGYQLVVANLPAKAGAPVLARLLAAAAEAALPEGRIAVVVVAPLAEAVRREFTAAAELIHEQRGSGHCVLHGRPRPPAAAPATETAPDGPPGAALAAYHRHQGAVTVAGISFPLTTVYGLPDFDTPSHLIQLTATLLQRRAVLPSGPPGRDSYPCGTEPHRFHAGASAEWTVLAWNPGQGHLAVWLARAWAAAQRGPDGAGLRFTLVSRDALQLLAARANLARNGVPESAVTLRHEVGLPRGAAAAYDLALLHPDEDLSAGARRELPARLAPLLRPDGQVALYGSAPAIAPLLAQRRPLTLVRESRRRALRAALLRVPIAEAP